MHYHVLLGGSLHNNGNNNNDDDTNLQAFQLTILARYLLGEP